MTPWKIVLTSLLLAHAALLACIDCSNSPTKDEVGHLPASIYIWQTGRFDLYPVNPPLVRAIAALPVLLCEPVTDWTDGSWGLGSRPEWPIGQAFVSRNGGERTCWFFCLARWACIPFSVLGGYFCYRWARELYGEWSGITAVVLWCFCPNVLAWGATICPDAAAAAVGVTANYSFWRWLKAPDWTKATIAGVLLGVVQLTKMTWIILFAVWPLIWLLWNWPPISRDGLRRFAQLAVVLALGLYVLNLGYLLDGTFKLLGDYTFASHTLAGPDSLANQGHGGNRFVGTWLGLLPIPLPEAYVAGMDLQKLDFELGKPSYLCGEWRNHGWWYYYLVCVALKVPLGTCLLGLLAVGITVSGWKQKASDGRAQQPSAMWRDEMMLLLPAAVVFILVSLETGFSRHFRYVLPCFPFVYIWISKVAQVGRLKWLMAAALAWSVVSSLLVYPHSMSYFNELAGGPTGGHRYLLDANIDWGQDLRYLKRWLDEHPEAKPLRMAHEYFVNPETLGIESQWAPCGPVRDSQASTAHTEEVGPQPGWYAMSVDRIHAPEYEYFQRFQPVAMAGYSIYIYKITPNEANMVRRELGLPEVGEAVNAR
jgi:hypothetical protein